MGSGGARSRARQHRFLRRAAQGAHAGVRQRLRRRRRGPAGQSDFSHRISEQGLRLHGLRAADAARHRRRCSKARLRRGAGGDLRPSGERRGDCGGHSSTRRRSVRIRGDGTARAPLGGGEREPASSGDALPFHPGEPGARTLAARPAPCDQGRNRSPGGRAGPDSAEPADCRGGGRGPRQPRRSDVVPAGTSRKRCAAVSSVQVPDHARRALSQRTKVAGHGAAHSLGPLPARNQPRRTSATVECRARGAQPGGPSSALDGVPAALHA